MLPFLFAGFISYLNGKYEIRIAGILFEVFIVSVIHQYWIGIFMLGGLAQAVKKCNTVKHMLDKNTIKYMILICSIILIRRAESWRTYWIDGICVVFFLLVLENSCRMKRLMERCRILSFVGKHTMPMFLIHSLIINTVGKRMVLLQCVNVYVVFIICVFVTVFLSLWIQLLLNIHNRLIDFGLKFLTQEHRYDYN